MIKKEQKHHPAEEELPETLAGVEEAENEKPSGDSGETSADEAPKDTRTPEEIARDEAEQWRDKYLRQLAEFDNFRKRMRQESELQALAIRESLMLSLLPVKDDFDRMLGAETEDEDAFRKGIEMVRDKLNAFLDNFNVKLMEARGTTFDPGRHDALMMRPTADFPAGTVLDVISAGYTMGDRVIRHAQVVVSEAPNDPESED